MFDEVLPCRVQDGISGRWQVDSFQITKTYADYLNLLYFGEVDHKGLYCLSPGLYKRLKHDDFLVTSNTRIDFQMYFELFERAEGRVLINGLGIGLSLQIVLARSSVTDVTVVERSSDVLSLIAPAFESDRRVTFVNDDAFSYKPKKYKTFDSVWHDIWDRVSENNRHDMTRLHRKYGSRTRWQSSWSRSLMMSKGGKHDVYRRA